MGVAIYDLDRIRAAVPLKELCEVDGLVFVRESGNWKASCPFHHQPGKSFTIHGESQHRAHCYGCGWNGDVFAYYAESRGLNINDKETFKETVAALGAKAGLAGVVSSTVVKPSIKKPAAPEARLATLEGRRKPWLPQMRLLRPAELEQLAALRGISVPALEAAVADKRLGYADWPPADNAEGRDSRSKASWVVTDPERWTAQLRTLDGSLYPGRDGQAYKSHSMKNVCWPVGAAQGWGREKICVVEGGTDMLAAYQLALDAGVLSSVVVWCLFGASVRLCREALEMARGKRVRIFADNDPPQVKEFKRRPSITVRPGMEGAARWQAQFEEAGAASVDVYDLEPLGEGMGDLNDVVRAGTTELDLDHFFDF